MPLPALRVPGRSLASRAYCRLRLLRGPGAWICSALGTPLGLDPPSGPVPRAPDPPPRRCHSPRSRPHSAPSAHPVCPSPALRFQPPAASLRPGRPAATLDPGPLWSCPWSARSAASPPPPPAATARKGAPAARGIPPAAPLTRGYPGPSPTQTPGPRGSAGQALGSALSTLDFRDPSTFFRSPGFLKVPAPATLG